MIDPKIYGILRYPIFSKKSILAAYHWTKYDSATNFCQISSQNTWLSNLYTIKPLSFDLFGGFMVLGSRAVIYWPSKVFPMPRQAVLVGGLRLSGFAMSKMESPKALEIDWWTKWTSTTTFEKEKRDRRKWCLATLARAKSDWWLLASLNGMKKELQHSIDSAIGAGDKHDQVYQQACGLPQTFPSRRTSLELPWFFLIRQSTVRSWKQTPAVLSKNGACPPLWPFGRENWGLKLQTTVESRFFRPKWPPSWSYGLWRLARPQAPNAVGLVRIQCRG